MKKVVSIFTSIILIFVISTSAFAFSVLYIPGDYDLDYYIHSSCAGSLYVLTAHSAWNNVPGCDIAFDNKGNSTGTITLGDSRCDVAEADFLTIPGFPTDANGITAMTGDNFDVFTNSTVDWTTVSRSGIYTHEFGHVVGLADLHAPPLNFTSASDVPTMWFSDTAMVNYTYVNVSAQFTSLTSDDTSGAQYIGGRI